METSTPKGRAKTNKGNELTITEMRWFEKDVRQDGIEHWPISGPDAHNVKSPYVMQNLLHAV